MYGLYFADAGQHLENRLFVDHNQPDCVSNVLYKGALQGTDARTVWVGDVLIRKEAEGTDDDADMVPAPASPAPPDKTKGPAIYDEVERERCH